MVDFLEQLQTLSVYVPPAVARLAFEDPLAQPGGSSRRFHAATVFADISGFTPLAEELASSGVRGAEELTAVLNLVFETLITTVETHGGNVVKFGGDALSLIWPCPEDQLPEAVWRAVQAAFAMQAAMSSFAIVSTSQGQFELRMKIGLSAGELLEVHAGGVFSRWEYVLAGEPMAAMSSAENLATAGEIVIDETAWRLVEGRERELTPAEAASVRLDAEKSYLFGDQIEPGFYRLSTFWGGLAPRPRPRPGWSTLDRADASKVVATLRSYIPGAISSLLESGHKDMLAELKPMTICFVGFDGFDYNDDPEAGRRLSDFLQDAQEIIYFYEGSVNKLAVGDKGSVLLVLFGAPPFFHEDDEVRAVACALGLRKVANRHQLQVGIGLAAGSVFAGPLGAPQRREYSVIGDTVNLAARLMQKAGQDEVWVDQSVHAQAGRFFEFDDLGPVQVKGKTEPRRVYRALHEKEQDQLETVARYLLSELTGRDKELAVIDELGEKVWAGQGQVLLLSGEAGVGKSRLAGEIVRRWLEWGGVPHSGDCVSYGRQTPYLPWRSVLASIAGLSPRLSVEQRLTRLADTLSHLPPPAAHAAAGETAAGNEDYWLERLPLLADIMGLECPETSLTQSLSEDLRRDNVFAAIRALVLAEAEKRPTLILLEDTHWSDELSLELAVSLAAGVNDAPLMLTLVHRPLGNPAPMSYQRLRSLPYTTRLEVNELDPEASLKLVQNKLGVKELPPALANMIRSKGQGNPFFIEELVNSLLSIGALKVEDGRCRLTGDLNEIELPDTVQKVVLARIDRLQEEEKMTLKVAAAIGRTFQRDLLEAVHPWVTTGATLQEHLVHLQAEDFTRPEAQENGLDFLFKHVITQEVAYETMLYAQRRQLHATIGAVLESRYSHNENEVIDLLAYHYARSDDHQKALNYLGRAAQKALKGYANEAAISYFNEALKLAQALDNVKVQYEVLAGREQAYNRLGNRMAQADDLAEMKHLAQTHNNPGQLIETGNRQIVLATNLGEYKRAIAIAQEMLARAEYANEPEQVARTLTNLGITYWRQGDYPRARQSMRRAMESEGANQAPQLKAVSLNYLGLIHTQLAEYEQARADYQAALKIYQTIGDKGGQAGCANNMGLLESSLGHYELAQQYYNQALSICHATGDRLREGISLNTLGQVHTILGNLDLAREQLQQSLTIRQTIGDRRGEAFCLHDLGALHLAAGESSQAVKRFEAARRLRRELGETGNYVASLAAKGEAHLAQNDLLAAGQCLPEAIDLVQQETGSGEYPPQNIWWIYSRVCRAQGDSDQAERALRRAHELVQAKAAQITAPELRRSYLENVKTNAAIIAAMDRRG